MIACYYAIATWALIFTGAAFLADYVLGGASPW